MPAPVVEPMPPLRASRRAPPDEAQEASYLAASARISSFCRMVRGMGLTICSLFVLSRFRGQMTDLEPEPRARPRFDPHNREGRDMPTPQELEQKFWSALKSDMTMMLGLDGVEDGHA